MMNVYVCQQRVNNKNTKKNNNKYEQTTIDEQAR